MSPDLLLIGLFGALCGALFHLLFRGRRLVQLLTSVVIGIVGFALGHMAGQLAGTDIATIGRLHVAEGFAASTLGLIVARWLKP